MRRNSEDLGMNQVGFGATVRATRKAKGWTQTELARQAGVVSSSVCAVEKQFYAEPHKITVQRIVHVLGLQYQLPEWGSTDG